MDVFPATGAPLRRVLSNINATTVTNHEKMVVTIVIVRNTACKKSVYVLYACNSIATWCVSAPVAHT